MEAWEVYEAAQEYYSRLWDEYNNFEEEKPDPEKEALEKSYKKAEISRDDINEAILHLENACDAIPGDPLVYRIKSIIDGLTQLDGEVEKILNEIDGEG